MLPGIRNRVCGRTLHLTLGHYSRATAFRSSVFSGRTRLVLTAFTPAKRAGQQKQEPALVLVHLPGVQRHGFNNTGPVNWNKELWLVYLESKDACTYARRLEFYLCPVWNCEVQRFGVLQGLTYEFSILDRHSTCMKPSLKLSDVLLAARRVDLMSSKRYKIQVGATLPWSTFCSKTKDWRCCLPVA